MKQDCGIGAVTKWLVVNPLQSNVSIHSPCCFLYNSSGTDKENLFNNQEIF